MAEEHTITEKHTAVELLTLAELLANLACRLNSTEFPARSRGLAESAARVAVCVTNIALEELGREISGEEARA